MGPEESQTQPSSTDQDNITGIPPMDPFILKLINGEKLPDDVFLDPQKIIQAIKLLKNYFQSISYHVNKREDQIAAQMKNQVDTYIVLAQKLNARKSETEKRLSDLLNELKLLDEAVKQTTDSLTLSIQKADQIAQAIDPDMPKFQIE